MWWAGFLIIGSLSWIGLNHDDVMLAGNLGFFKWTLKIFNWFSADWTELTQSWVLLSQKSIPKSKAMMTKGISSICKSSNLVAANDFYGTKNAYERRYLATNAFLYFYFLKWWRYFIQRKAAYNTTKRPKPKSRWDKWLRWWWKKPKLRATTERKKHLTKKPNLTSNETPI